MECTKPRIQSPDYEGLPTLFPQDNQSMPWQYPFVTVRGKRGCKEDGRREGPTPGAATLGKSPGHHHTYSAQLIGPPRSITSPAVALAIRSTIQSVWLRVVTFPGSPS